MRQGHHISRPIRVVLWVQATVSWDVILVLIKPLIIVAAKQETVTVIISLHHTKVHNTQTTNIKFYSLFHLPWLVDFLATSLCLFLHLGGSISSSWLKKQTPISINYRPYTYSKLYNSFIVILHFYSPTNFNGLVCSTKETKLK